MGRLIAVVGNSGVGKTCLARQLCQLGGFTTGLEQHEQRPYQRLFSRDHQRYALPNQVDYLLLRAEQEAAIRGGSLDGVVDGGLELDFHVFTRLFHHKGYLDEDGYRLCQRFFRLLRSLLPPPEVIVYLTASLEAIAARFERRKRSLEIAVLEDLERMQNFLDEWIDGVTDIPVLRLDSTLDGPDYSKSSKILLRQIDQLLAESPSTTLSPDRRKR